MSSSRSKAGTNEISSMPFRIGVLAGRTGRSVHAIRWYEAQVLIPGVKRDSGGRCMYLELHVGWLELMDRLRRSGMSIAEMRDYATLVRQGARTLSERQALLSSHRERIKATIASLEQALGHIDRKIGFYRDWVATGRQPGAWMPEELSNAVPKRARQIMQRARGSNRR